MRKIKLAESIMFAYGLYYPPSAFQPFRKNNKITSTKCDGFKLTMHLNFSFQEITTFFVIIFPVKFRYFTGPYWPGINFPIFNFVIIQIFNFNIHYIENTLMVSIMFNKNPKYFIRVPPFFLSNLAIFKVKLSSSQFIS